MSRFWKSVRTALPDLAHLLVIVACLMPPTLAWAERGPDARIAQAQAARILEDARRDTAPPCSEKPEVLARVLCRGTLRVGLRVDYPGFSARDPQGNFDGFEVAIARRIAAFLGVDLLPVAVDARSRIPSLASRAVDVVIATMGHTEQRDPHALFVRPHYFESRTAVVGARDSTVSDWSDLQAGRVACLPIGASFNILFVQRHVRILTFETIGALMDALNFGQCALIAHDNTLFGKYLADPAWSKRFSVRFTFSPLPWGMAVSNEGGQSFRALLSALSVQWHADGTFLGLAEHFPIDPSFLRAQRQLFGGDRCMADDGTIRAECLAAPVDTTAADKPTRFAGTVTAGETMLAGWTSLSIDLSMLKSQAVFNLLWEGVLYSLALVIGSMIATMAWALLFGRLAGTRFAMLRFIGAGLSLVGQTTPMPLLLFFGYILAGGLTVYSGPVALVTAIITLGFYNGSYAGHALHEAEQSLLMVAPSASGGAPLRATIAVAWTQIVAFLVNATKGSPAADMIGVPEFLNVISDLTAHQRDRIGLYLLLLVFYSALVLLAISGLSVIERRFVRFWRAGA